MSTLLFLHRWIGVVLAAFMTLWLGFGLAISVFVLGWLRLQVTGLSAHLNWQAKFAARKPRASPRAEVSGA